MAVLATQSRVCSVFDEWGGSNSLCAGGGSDESPVGGLSLRVAGPAAQQGEVQGWGTLSSLKLEPQKRWWAATSPSKASTAMGMQRPPSPSLCPWVTDQACLNTPLSGWAGGLVPAWEWFVFFLLMEENTSSLSPLEGCKLLSHSLYRALPFYCCLVLSGLLPGLLLLLFASSVQQRWSGRGVFANCLVCCVSSYLALPVLMDCWAYCEIELYSFF